MPLDDDFLKQKRYQRQSLRPEEKEAVDAAKRSADRTAGQKGEKIDWARPGALVGNYLQRFRELLDNRPTSERRVRALEALKGRLHQELLIQPDHPVFTVSSPERIREILVAKRNAQGQPIDPKGEIFPLSHFDKRIIRFYEEGRGIGTVPEEEQQKEIATIIEEQQHSLDTWIDYLSSDDAKYPDPLKYWAFRSILKMGRFDKEKHRFTNREGKGSVSPFPELNREALAVILADTEKKYAGKTDFAFTSRYDIAQDQKDAYLAALGTGKKDSPEDFATLYALAIDAFKPISEDLLAITEGKWRTYPRGSDPKLLVDAIANYGTGWCLRGESTARRYLEGNTLSVYFSRTSKEPDAPALVPRVVMVVNPQNQITEVRGIKAHEHLDAHIIPTVDQKLQEHPDGEKYRKKTKDMERLTTLDHLLKSGTFSPLSTEDQKTMLTFLYELDSRIEGFGYEAAGRDPRIEELRSKRHPDDDMLTLFGDEHGPCRPDQIAKRPDQLKEGTKAYIGPLAPGIFSLLEKYTIEHIYTSFPEGRIRRESLTIGGKTAKELEEALDGKDPHGNRKFQTSSYTRSILKNRDFTTTEKPEDLTLIRLAVRDLGFPNGATTDEIFNRAQKLGLELCPAEVGPHYRLQNTDQPMNDWFYIGMKPITASGGNPRVFGLERLGDGLWLDDSWAKPSDHWLPDDQFAFRLRKSRKDS